MRSPAVIAVLLLLSVLAVYSPTLNSGFINYDDPAYVTKNARVLEGLSLPNVNWAFRATIEANRHPVTWISHMTDVQMFGTNPRGPHAVNVFVHALNVVLLFFTLYQVTRDLARSALVGALFAFHPLNAECDSRTEICPIHVFFLLALAAYGWYAEKGSAGRYLLVILAFAFGLAAKPMIVTSPCPFCFLCGTTGPWSVTLLDPQLLQTVLGLRTGSGKDSFALSAASSWITLCAQRAGGALGRSDLLLLRGVSRTQCIRISGQAQAAIRAYQAALQLSPGMVEAEQRLDVLRAGR